MTPPRLAITDEQMVQLAGYVAANIASNGVGKKLDEIKSAVLELQARSETDHELVASHQVTLHGDGKGVEGILSQLKRLSDKVREMNAVAVWAIGIVAGVLITTGVGAFIYLVVTHPLSVP